MVDVIGRAKVIVTSQVDKSSIDQTGGKIGAGIKAGAVVGVTALASLTAAGVKLYQGFEQGEAQSRKLGNALANMKAGEAADEVEGLATEISRLTGVNEDAIKQGQTLLASFSEVADTAGETGGLFDRATRAAVDLAATGFGSIESSAIQLGKALQEPGKGVAALAKSGAFTKAQQEYVKALDKTGKRAEAQAYILKVLEGQVEGAAEASATGSEKIKNSLGEAGDAVGNILDTLAGNKTDDKKGGKSLSQRIDDVTDSLNKFAESEGLKEFQKNLSDAGDSGFGQQFAEDTDARVKGIGEFLLVLSEIPGKLEEVTADINDNGLWDGVSDDLVKMDKKFADWWDERVEESANSRRDINRSLGRLVDDIKATPEKIERTAKAWGRAGAKLLREFISGFAQGVVPVDLGQKIKDAINQALPDTVTFFGGRGGLPPITVDVPQFASGVRNFGGGLAKVGEHGAEYAVFPPGTDVLNASQTQQIDAARGGGSVTINNIYNGPESSAYGRKVSDWQTKHGTRFGAATTAGVPV